MKNSLINYITIAGLLLFSESILSCKKLIEIPQNPPSSIEQGKVFADSVDVMNAIAGIYSYYYGSQTGFAYQTGYLPVYAGLSSDEISYSDAGSPDIPQFFDNTLSPANSNLGSFMWRNPYVSIYQVNACITGINSSTGLSATLTRQLLGELDVVRAFYYFNLVNLFGGLPLAVTTNYKITSVLPRASIDSVYNQIIADLTDARQKLTPAYPSEGKARPNSYTASALLAKVYLYREQWQAAYDAASEVINSGDYSLEQDLNNVFLDGSSEAIWQLPVAKSDAQTADGKNFIPYADDVVPPFPVTDYLIGAFETGDKRLENWIGTNKVDDNGTEKSYYYPYKYKNKDGDAATTEDFMIFRLGELYLIRSEAAAHLNNLEAAAADLNMVRNRAGIKNYIPASQAEMLTAILHERQTELFCEWGNRWFDLKRTGAADDVLSVRKTGWQSFDALYPIPLSEIRLDPHLAQNPGY